MQVFPDIHLVDGVTCNVYIISEPEGLTILDTGMPGAEPRILAAIQAMGKRAEDVRHILITHQHVDHIGGLAVLKAATGADVWAHPDDADTIEGKAPRETPKGPLGLVFRFFLFPRLKPAGVTHRVRAGATLPVLASEGGLQVVETPGHTMGHISFYLPSRKLLLAGDAVSVERERIKPPPSFLSADMPLAMRSIARLAELDVEACLVGHGAPVLSGARAQLARLVESRVSARA